MVLPKAMEDVQKGKAFHRQYRWKQEAKTSEFKYLESDVPDWVEKEEGSSAETEDIQKDSLLRRRW